MIKKIGSSVLILILIITTYCASQFYWLAKTEELPYSSIRDLGSASCYLAFKVQHNDSIYRVVMSNYFSAMTIRKKSKFHHYLYSLYMNEVLRYNLSVSLDDSLFTEIKYDIVEDEILREYEKRDLTRDSTLVNKDNRLSVNLSHRQRKAVIYLLLEKGINCCVEDFSGRVIVSQ